MTLIGVSVIVISAAMILFGLQFLTPELAIFALPVVIFGGVGFGFGCSLLVG